MCVFVGKTESRQRAVEKSRSPDSHAKYPTRGVRRHGRFARAGLERRQRRAAEEELPVAFERRISPVRETLSLTHTRLCDKNNNDCAIKTSITK